MQTDTLTLVLQRDQNMPHDCFMLTAFPELRTPSAKLDPQLQNRLIKALPQTNAYQQASNTEKIFLQYQIDPSSTIPCRYDPSKDEIQVYAKDTNHIYRVCITDKTLRYENRTNQPHSQYQTSNRQIEQQFKKNHPKTNKLAGTLQNKIRVLTGHQPNRPLPAAPIPSSTQNQPSPSP